MLALLVVRAAADAATSKWVADVLADARDYVVGAPWKAPNSWRETRQDILKTFKTLTSVKSTEVRRGGAGYRAHDRALQRRRRLQGHLCP